MSTTPLSTASWGRRVLALALDWVASWLVTIAIAGTEANAAIPLLVFWIEASVGVALAGGSFGQMITRIRVLRTNGRTLNLLMAMLRQALVVLVIPPLVFKPDGRGLHDLATDSGAYLMPKR
ncbi:MAG: RDD family protein [Myxococcales bacterium]|nr:MAG: RDD family protein [Myxococcales bacterium]